MSYIIDEEDGWRELQEVILDLLEKEEEEEEQARLEDLESNPNPKQKESKHE